MQNGSVDGRAEDVVVERLLAERLAAHAIDGC
jgi:hypothetical protein